jgi:hypothetical protein
MKRVRACVWLLAFGAVAVRALAEAADAPHAVTAAPRGSERAREAFALCVDDDRGTDTAARWARGVTLAEEAVAADDSDATAHFALFCNLGKQAEAAGISVTGLVAVRRLRREIDRTLALAPDWPDALAAKGSFLLQLPRVLGGDLEEGERLLRRAIALDPRFAEAHFELARGLLAYGRKEQARAEGTKALAVARATDDRSTAERARRLLAGMAK